MSNYRTRNRTILAKVEGTAGTDSSPVVGTDAVLVESPTPSGGLELLNTDEVTGSLDPRAPIVGGGGKDYSATCLLRGSGTGGTAPDYDDLLQACALSSTNRAVDLTGTAQAGAAGSITLAAGATGVIVAEIITLTGGTGAGQTRVITAWNNTSKVASVYPNWGVNPDNTSQYSIKASVIYKPASTSLVNATVYDYQHASNGDNSRLRKILGWAGNAQFTLPTRGLGRIAFNGRGKFVTPTDVTPPAAATYQAQRPIAFQAADVYLNQVATKINQFSLDLGNNVQAADDPAATFGIDICGITGRNVNGRINPRMALLSERNVIADFLASTTRVLWLRYGTPGNGVSIYIPQVGYSGSEEEDINGFGHEGIPFAAQGVDAGVYFTIY